MCVCVFVYVCVECKTTWNQLIQYIYWWLVSFCLAAPLAPENFTVVTQTPTSVTLGWDICITDRDSFKITYTPRDEEETVEATPDSTQYEVTGLEPDTTYEFTIVTVSVDSESSPLEGSGDTGNSKVPIQLNSISFFDKESCLV